ncbi:SDR family NAD(P)-dependent oxidoreductase [bacterium]|nr:SDR family NAD(P)-dependent oxidoreductase [bacterium]
MNTMSNQVVIVSGAAGGLGREVVRTFLAEGATVCALDNRHGRVSAFEEGLPGQMFLFEDIDLTDKAVGNPLAGAVHDRVGKVDVIVNTVGGFAYGETVHGLSFDTWERMIGLNVYSFLNLTGAFVPDLIEKGHGKVISVGSGASIKGSAKMGAYAAAKGALLRLTESMAAELLAYGIQVNCVLPGTIDTPKNRAEMPDADRSKWVSPRQIAETILFLSSTEADAITGATIPVFGHP